MFSRKHSAGCEDILSAGSPDGCCYSQIIQTLLEDLNNRTRRGLIWKIRNLMEAYQIHSALQSLEHPEQRICMHLGVIDSGKLRILEALSALAREIILLYEVDHILDRPGPLHRHHAETLRAERIVKTDSQVAFAFLQISLEIWQDTDC